MYLCFGNDIIMCTKMIKALTKNGICTGIFFLALGTSLHAQQAVVEKSVSVSKDTLHVVGHAHMDMNFLIFRLNS